MTLGEKIRKYRLLHDMTQKELGIKVGFSTVTADTRIRQYEKDAMAPKSDIRNKLVQALDVDPSALSDVDIHSIEDVVRTFFFMEEYLDFKIENIDLDNYTFLSKNKINFQKRESSMLNSYMYIWQQQKKNFLNAKTNNEEDSLKEYELWKSRFAKSINDYWNSILNRINTYYASLVNEISHKKTKIVYSSEFIVQIRKLIQAGLEFKVDSEIRGVNDGYFVFIFKVSDLLSPKSEEIEIQFAEFLSNLKTLKEYGMIIDTTVLTFATGNTISYHLLLNPLMQKCCTIQELIQFEKNKASMDEFSIELFNINYDKEFHSSRAC